MDVSSGLRVTVIVTVVLAAGCLGGFSGGEDRPATEEPTPSSLVVETPTNGSGTSPLTVEVRVGEVAGVDASTLTVYDETTDRGLPTSRDGSTMTATLRGRAGTTHDLRVTARTDDGRPVERRVTVRIVSASTAGPSRTETVTPTGGATATPEPAASTAALTTAPPAPNAAPVADAGDDRTVTVGETVSFDGTGSSDPDGTVERYEWDLDGDGTVDATRSTPTVSRTYASTGTYAVAVTVADDDGATATDTVTVTVRSGRAPVADLAVAPTAAGVGQSVNFDATGSSDPDGTITVYEWDFDGDGAVDRQTADPTVTHAYATTGAYDATVTVVDDDGQTDAAAQSVTVRGDSSPTADAGQGGTYGVGEAVSFDGAGSSDPDGTITEYGWDFDGDGTVEERSSDPRATHAYGAAGTYDARLVVTDDDGNTDTDQVRIEVQNAAPTADAGPDRTVRTGETATFDGSGSTDSDGTIARYEWDLDGDGTYDTAGGSAGATRSYASAGTYEVRLRVTDDDGTTATDTATVTVVSNRAPTADAGGDATVTVGEGHTFDASGSTDSDGRIVEYRWDLDGDGAIDRRTTDPALTHAYGSTGTYDATVVVVDDDGATDRDGATVTVTN